MLQRSAGFAALLMLASLPAACTRQPSAPAARTEADEAIALVAGEPITLADVQETAARNGYDLHKPQDSQAALRDAINFEILAAEAKRQHYLDDPEIRRLMKSMAVQKLVKDRVDEGQPQTTLSDDELKAYYKDNLPDFSQPTLAKGRVLFLLKREGQDDLLAKKVQEVKQRIADGQDFTQIIVKYSDSAADQANGGMTNWITKGQPSERFPQPVLEALFGMKQQDTPRGPIDAGQGTWFVQLAELREGGPLPFEQAKRAVTHRLYRQKRLSVYDGYVGKLKEDFPVEAHPERLEAALQKSRAQSGPPMGPVRIAR